MPVINLERSEGEVPEGDNNPPEERYLIAAQEARRHHMHAFQGLLEQHRNHLSFRPQSFPRSLEWGFTCACSGAEQEWRIKVSTLRTIAVEARQRLQDLILRSGYTDEEYRNKKRSDRRAKVLLHQHLTRLQIKQLRHTKSFQMIGKDGVTYELLEGTCNNVREIVNGKPVRSLCVIFKHNKRIPIYDLLLAQKLMLEACPEEFHKLAIVHNLDEAGNTIREPVVDLELVDNNDLDNPVPWLEERAQAIA